MNNVNDGRVEKKYIIGIAEHNVLSSILKSTMDIDEFADDNGEYIVRSLYFDSPDYLDFHQKIQGLYRRTKIRLRIYDTDQQFVKIENKRKYGGYTKKQSVLIGKKDALDVMNLDYSTLLKYDDRELDEIFSVMATQFRTPKSIVEYCREAYVLKDLNIRINFDKRIKAAHSSDLFSNNLDFIPIQDDNYYVLEVKYNNVLPIYIQEILSSFDLYESTYSKYVKSVF